MEDPIKLEYNLVARQYSAEELFSICLNMAQQLQAFYITGSTSKYPYGFSL